MTTIWFLCEWAVRSSVLILAGAILLWLPRLKNPSTRLAACIAMLAGSLAIPVASGLLPRVPVAIPSHPAAALPAGPTVERGPFVAPQPSPADKERAPSPPFNWPLAAATLYALVAAALLLRLLAGAIAGMLILRRSSVTELSVEGRPVRESERVSSPAAIGIFRCAVVLPLDWRDWPPQKLAAVLAHEGSHLRRNDVAIQFISALHRALLWASPLSWWLHRTLVRTAEEVSDNDAILAGVDRVAYAEILLEFVRRAILQAPTPGAAMATYDRPEKRIRRILNATAVPRRLGRFSVAAIGGVGAALAYFTAAAAPSDAVAAADLPNFEVASIKPVSPDDPGPHTVGIKVFPGGRVVLSTLNLKTLIGAAFRLSYWQIAGGEEWIAKDEFQIEAKPPAAMQARIRDLRHTLFGIESEELRAMLQALLIDRFQLKFHRETKTGDVYLLERSGKKFRLRPTEIPAEEAAAAPSNKGAFGSIGYVGGRWGVFATSMPQLAKFSADFVFHVPVLDRTETQGVFDYRQNQPDIEPKYSGDQSDSFRRFLAESGLKVERSKGAVETFVIDHAARPLPN